MVWLLQLTNLQCPCLGLMSNELRDLLFRCIKGAIREASQFLPPVERYLPGMFYLPCDCPPTACTVPLGWKLPWNPETLKPGQRKQWGSGFCRAQRQKEPKGLLQTCALTFIPPSCLTCLSCLINPSPPSQAAFFFPFQRHSGLCSSSSLEWLYLTVL